MTVLAVTTTARLTAQYKLNNADTDLLTTIINSVSMQVEKYLQRSLTSESFTEKFDIWWGHRTFWPYHSPVTTVTSVTDNGTTVSSDYYVKKTDVVLLDDEYQPQIGNQSLVIVGTGGMAANTAAFLTSYPDIVAGCERWIVEQYKRLLGPVEAQSVALPTGQSTTYVPTQMPQYLQNILAPYKRRVV